MSATAYAHYLNPPIEFMLRAQSKPIKGLSFERLDKRLDSGLVGAKMFSLDAFDVIKKSKVFENLDATVITAGAKQSDKKKTSINPARETVFETDRIVIGYDDERRKVLVHDPSFGPATEYDYDVFMRMWQLIECDVEYADTRIDRQPSTATKYRARLPNELAAERYMNGVSLLFGDKVEEALAELQQGLAIGGISDGYKHILHFERSSVLLGLGRAKEALAEATLSTQLVPENPAAWAILAAALPKTDETDREVRAKEAKAKADSVLNGEEPIKRLCRAIPNEFLVFWLHPVRGWAGEAISSKRLTGMH